MLQSAGVVDGNTGVSVIGLLVRASVTLVARIARRTDPLIHVACQDDVVVAEAARRVGSDLA